MKVELPENQKEITLGQYQDYMKLIERTDLSKFEFIKRKVKIFTGLNYKQVSEIKQNDIDDIVLSIDKALHQESEFKNRFEMGGVEFGFIPNFDDIKSKEYFDLTTYNANVETLHNLMAILFRPIKKEDKLGNYKIAEYKGSKEWADAMKHTPLSIVNGALVFFYNLSNELKNYTLRYMIQEQEKERKHRSILKSGVGMRQLINWLTGRHGNINSLET